jgi:hypothetical protein
MTNQSQPDFAMMAAPMDEFRQTQLPIVTLPFFSFFRTMFSLTLHPPSESAKVLRLGNLAHCLPNPAQDTK